MADRLPTRAELELEASILRTNQAIVQAADTARVSGVNISELPEDVQQGISAARRATRGG